MSEEKLIRTRLARYIEQVATDIAERKISPEWGGHQLVALVRHWGYRGHDWHMPDPFEQFDLVMADLECFPDGSRTTPDDIVQAARAVRDVARSL